MSIAGQPLCRLYDLPRTSMLIAYYGAESPMELLEVNTMSVFPELSQFTM